MKGCRFLLRSLLLALMLFNMACSGNTGTNGATQSGGASQVAGVSREGSPVAVSPATAGGTTTAVPVDSPLVVALVAVDERGVTGTARLLEMPQNQTRAELTVTGPQASGFHARIQPGQCGNLGSGSSYEVPIGPDGTSVVNVPASLDSLRRTSHAVVVRMATVQDPVACGDILAERDIPGRSG